MRAVIEIPRVCRPHINERNSRRVAVAETVNLYCMGEMVVMVGIVAMIKSCSVPVSTSATPKMGVTEDFK